VGRAMRVRCSAGLTGCILGLVFGASSCSGKTAADVASFDATAGRGGSAGSDPAADASNCPAGVLKPSGSVVDLVSIFNYAGGHWAAARDTDRFAFVYGGWGVGGLRMILLDATGAQISELLLLPSDSGAEVAQPLAIASDGTRFGLLSQDWTGAAAPLVRFRLVSAGAESVASPMDLGPAIQNGSLGSVLWVEDGWAVVWSGGDVRDQEFLFVKLAPNGVPIAAPRVLLTQRDPGSIRMARTPSGVMALAWQTPDSIRWARLEEDGTLAASADFQVGQTQALEMSSDDRGFVAGWTRIDGSYGDIVLVAQDGTVRCGPKSIAVGLGAFAASGSAMLGVGARVIDSSSSAVEVFNVLDDCTIGPSATIPAKRRNAFDFSLGVTRHAMLAAWVEYDTQSGNVRASPFRSCADRDR
jgi:hypothetical protein